MRVLSISADPAFTSESSAVFNRHKIYAKEIGKLVVVVRTIGGSSEIIEHGNLRVVPTASNSVIKSFFDLKNISLRESRELRPEVVTAQDPFEHGLIAWRTTKRTGARLHLQIHTDVASSGYSLGGKKNKIRQFMARFLLKRAAYVRAVSQRIARGLERWGIRRNVVVLPISPDVGELIKLPTPKRSEGEFTVLTVSRLSREKRVDILIGAIAALNRKNINTRLLIAGDGPENEALMAYAEKLGVEDKVEFLGWQTFSAASEWADCYAQASSFEGYGLSLVEAAARGLPIITTSVGLVGEVLLPGESCLLARDAISFAQGIAELINNPTRCESLGSAAREVAKREIIPQEEYARRYKKSIELALADSRNVPPIMIVAQVIDQEDPVLGFFCRWVDEISKRVPAVTVVCLKKGNYQLPENVRVISLGKERESRLPHFIKRIIYAIKFKQIAWRERRKYKTVFVHMNQEYVLVAGLMWKLLGKRVLMWRNHYSGSWLTKIAGRLCDLVLCTSKKSFTADFLNSRLMPVGVDLNIFTSEGSEIRDPQSILMLGRIAPSKNINLLIEALATLKTQGVECRATIVGDPISKDEEYAASLKEMAESLGVSESINWIAGVPNRETPALYRSHGIFVNASQSGMFDKTIIEAAACGCRVVSASEDAAELFGGVGSFKLDSGVDSLAHALKPAIAGTDGWGIDLARRSVGAHSIEALIDSLASKLVH